MKHVAIFLLVAASGNVMYHLGQKNLPSSVNPLTLLTAVFTISFIFMAVASLVLSPAPLTASMKHIFTFPVLAISAGGLLVEFGVLYSYRYGSSVQWTGPAINGLAAIILVPTALFFLRESLSPIRILGVATTILGLFLISKK